MSVYCCDSARWTRRQESGHPDPGLSRRILESSCARKCCTEKRFFSQQVHSVVNSRRDLSRVSHCHTMAGDIYSSIEGGLQRTDIGANSLKLSTNNNITLLRFTPIAAFTVHQHPAISELYSDHPRQESVSSCSTEGATLEDSSRIGKCF